MKTFIPVYGSLMTIDLINETVKKAASHVNTCIDYSYIAPEDGKVCGKEVHEGDLILLMYSYPNESGERNIDNKTVIVIDKDNDLTKYIVGKIEADKKRREEYAKHTDCDTTCCPDCGPESAN